MWHSFPSRGIKLTLFKKALENDETLSGLNFISRIDCDYISPMFKTELTTDQEDALDTLFTNHVAPVQGE